MGESTNRECPFCKEQILSHAIRCKHCKANVPPEPPEHEGICPFCKEDIKPDAIRCKHCLTNLVLTSDALTTDFPDPPGRPIPPSWSEYLRLRELGRFEQGGGSGVNGPKGPPNPWGL